MNMKKILLLIMAFAVCHFSDGQVMAQADSLKNFHFVYIDHEPTTPVGQLCERINKLYNDAEEMGEALIVYLADETHPMISLTNVADSAAMGESGSKDAFYQIIDALQGEVYHEVSTADAETIKKLIGQDGSFPLFAKTDSGRMNYKSVTLDFYIGSRFWALRYNERIIAALFSSLKVAECLEKYPRAVFAFNVFKAKDDSLLYQEGKPFGLQNMDGINDKLNIIEY